MNSFNLHTKVKSEKLKLKSSLITLFKFVLLTFHFSLLTFNLSAQTDLKIGSNPGSKQTSAVLELESTTKGFLLPRMSPAQMAAISNPVVGLQIYNTTDSCIYVYRGVSGWYATCGGFNAWSLFGNTGINPATQFLGTTDAQPVILKTNGTERLRFDAVGAITQTGTGVVTFTGNTKATNGLDVTTAALTANAGATITGPAGGGGTVNLNTVGANTTNIGTAVSTTNLNGANLNIPALPAGSTTTDALVAVNRATGKADTLNIANLVSTGITADNGLTKTGANIQLGGTLIQATSIAQAGNSLSISGTGGATNINASGSSPTNIGNASSATAVVGTTTINTTGTSNTSIGNATGTITALGATSVNTSGTAATNIGNSGSAVTIAGTTGVTGTTTINTTGTANTSIGNATGTITALGATNVNTTGAAATSIGNATSATTINGTNLTIPSLPVGSTATDALVALNRATGKADTLNIAALVSGAFTANNGLTKTGSNVALGGPLVANTSIDQSTFSLTFSNGTHSINATGTGATNIGNSGSNVTIAGTTSVTGATTINTTGTLATSIGNSGSAVTIAGTTGVTGTTTINTTGTSNTSIGNATGTNTVLGATNVNTTGAAATSIGNATSATTINGTNLTIPSLPVGSTATDALVAVNRATGKADTLNIAALVSGAITANNGLTKTGANIQLGGALVQATAITQAGFDVNYSGGNVAIGSATSPNSTLQLTGSMGVSYRKVTSAASPYTVTSSDFIVLANATGGAVTITLPTASATLTGRIYTVGKSDEGTNAVTFSPALRLTEATTIASVNFAIKYRIVCDGTDWWIYNE